MKNKKNILTVVGIGVSLFIACIVPTVVTIVEDELLQSESKRYEIEEINLNSGDEDLIEKLSSIQEVLHDNVVMQKSIQALSQKQNDINKKVEEFLSLLNINIASDSAESVKFLKFSAVLMVMTDTDVDKVYSLWKCYAVDEEKREYIFWIDEETEKVLAFQIPYNMAKGNSEEFYVMLERLTKYYGFTSSAVIDKISDFIKREYAETGLRFSDDTKGKEVVLMLFKNANRLNFNCYPGQVTVYDSKSMER